LFIAVTVVVTLIAICCCCCCVTVRYVIALLFHLLTLLYIVVVDVVPFLVTFDICCSVLFITFGFVAILVSVSRCRTSIGRVRVITLFAGSRALLFMLPRWFALLVSRSFTVCTLPVVTGGYVRSLFDVLFIRGLFTCSVCVRYVAERLRCRFRLYALFVLRSLPSRSFTRLRSWLRVCGYRFALFYRALFVTRSRCSFAGLPIHAFALLPFVRLLRSRGVACGVRIFVPALRSHCCGYGLPSRLRSLFIRGCVVARSRCCWLLILPFTFGALISLRSDSWRSVGTLRYLCRLLRLLLPLPFAF